MTLWKAILPICTLLDQRDEVAQAQIGNSTAELEAVGGIVDSVINDTCDWVSTVLQRHHVTDVPHFNRCDTS